MTPVMPVHDDCSQLDFDCCIESVRIKQGVYPSCLCVTAISGVHSSSSQASAQVAACHLRGIVLRQSECSFNNCGGIPRSLVVEKKIKLSEYFRPPTTAETSTLYEIFIRMPEHACSLNHDPAGETHFLSCCKRAWISRQPCPCAFLPRSFARRSTQRATLR